MSKWQFPISLEAGQKNSIVEAGGKEQCQAALHRFNPHAIKTFASHPKAVSNILFQEFMNQKRSLEILREGLFSLQNHVQNEAMIYGYARVSTDGQSVDAQVRQLQGGGARRCSARWPAGPRPTAANFAARSTSSTPATC